jgi:predicted NBD/HSP70 family sugar kinase
MNSSRTTARDIRRRNRSLLLSTLFFEAPRSRLELGQLTGLSGATVSNVTAELVEERLIVEAGLAESDGGRPRVLLRVDPGYACVIGVDLGETGIKVELFDLAMARLATAEHGLSPGRPDPARVAGLIASGVREVIGQAGMDGESVLGLGVGVPGTVEHRPGPAGALVHAPTIGWRGVPLEDLLRERGLALPVFLDNGAKTQGQAEMWFGAGRGARHAVIALVGSGVAAAVVADGTTYRGASSSAGEWGHTTIVYGGRPCRCGSNGCLEAYVGAEGIIDRYRRLRGARPLPAGGEVVAMEAILAAAARSKAAAGLLEETAGFLGAGIANLINLFNPERVVLGGWAGLALGALLLPQIRDAARAHALEHAYAQTTIELCELGPDAVAFGAATLPVDALLSSGADPRGERARLGALGAAPSRDGGAGRALYR